MRKVRKERKKSFKISLKEQFKEGKKLNLSNRDTEVGYYMKNNKPILDPSADKYSHKKLVFFLFERK